MLDALIDWFDKDFKILEKNNNKILIKVKDSSNAIKCNLLMGLAHLKLSTYYTAFFIALKCTAH